MAGTSTESKGDVAATITSDSNLGELPFQVQIHYTDLEGAQAMRVLTQTKPVTRERIQAEDCEFRYLDFVFAFLYRNCEFTITLSDVEMMQCCNVVWTWCETFVLYRFITSRHNLIYRHQPASARSPRHPSVVTVCPRGRVLAVAYECTHVPEDHVQKHVCNSVRLCLGGIVAKIFHFCFADRKTIVFKVNVFVCV